MAGHYQTDVIGIPISGNALHNGYAVVGAQVTGNYKSKAPTLNKTTPTSITEDKYKDRFDDITYYTS